MELAYQLKIDKQKREKEIVKLDNAVKNLDNKVKELEEKKVCIGTQHYNHHS